MMSRFGLNASVFLVLLLLLIACEAEPELSSENDEAWKDSFFHRYQNDSVLSLELQLDLDALKESASDADTSYHAAIRSDAFPVFASIPVKISARGQSRRRICDVPPFHLNFSKDVNKDYSWTDYGKYKVVSHCLEVDSMSQLLLSEWLIYRIYEIISPYAFQTQWCGIRYITPTGSFDRHALLLEHADEMADRLSAKVVKQNPEKIQVHLPQYQKLVLFQFMVGNTDWNLNRSHNIEWLKTDTLPQPLMVPYDFDASGLINAPYATPHENLPIDTITERFFQYRGKKSDDFSAVIDFFQEKQSEIDQLVVNFPGLTETNRTRIRSYLDEFYKIIDQADWKDRFFSN